MRRRPSPLAKKSSHSDQRGTPAESLNESIEIQIKNEEKETTSEEKGLPFLYGKGGSYRLQGHQAVEELNYRAGKDHSP